MKVKGKVEIWRRQQFPDLLSNHLVCHIALRNFQNFLPLNTSSLPKCDALLLFSVGHLTAAEEEVAHYKLPGEEAGDKLIMEAEHLSDGRSYRRANCVKFSPHLPHFAPALSYL